MSAIRTGELPDRLWHGMPVEAEAGTFCELVRTADPLRWKLCWLETGQVSERTWTRQDLIDAGVRAVLDPGPDLPCDAFGEPLFAGGTG